MKKTDIAMIILIAAVSVVAAFFITRSIMGSPGEQKTVVKTIDKIEEGVEEVNPEIFNKDAINPAVMVELGKEAADSNNGS